MSPTPDRSLQQRREALKTANAIRTFRSALKKELKAGKVKVSDLLLEPPKEIESMKIEDLLMATPRLGRAKVNKLLKTCRISPSRSIGGINQRQRAELVSFVLRRY